MRGHLSWLPRHTYCGQSLTHSGKYIVGSRQVSPFKIRSGLDLNREHGLTAFFYIFVAKDPIDTLCRILKPSSGKMLNDSIYNKSCMFFLICRSGVFNKYKPQTSHRRPCVYIHIRTPVMLLNVASLQDAMLAQRLHTHQEDQQFGVFGMCATCVAARGARPRERLQDDGLSMAMTAESID